MSRGRTANRTGMRFNNHLNELGCNIMTISSVYASKASESAQVGSAGYKEKVFEQLKQDIYDFTVDDGDYSQTAIANLSVKWTPSEIIEVFRMFPNVTEIRTKGAHGNEDCLVFVIPLEGIRWKKPEDPRCEAPDFEPEEIDEPTV